MPKSKHPIKAAFIRAVNETRPKPGPEFTLRWLDQALDLTHLSLRMNEGAPISMRPSKKMAKARLRSPFAIPQQGQKPPPKALLRLLPMVQAFA